jgi:hypothetical protein
VQKDYYPVPINPNNPYDSIGMYHNTALVFALRRALPDSANPETYYNRVISELHDWPDSIGIYFEGWDDALDAAEDTFDINQTRDWGAYLSTWAPPTLSVNEIYFINRMGALSTSCTSAQQLEDSILAIEDEICNASWGGDENAAQCCISIFKHSFYFWSTLAGEDYLSKRSKINEELPAWVQFTFADVGGAAIGTYYGGWPVGTLTGGVLTSFGAGWVGGFLEDALDEIGQGIVDALEVICFFC